MSDIIVPMQEESFKTWSKKHRVFDKDGNAIDGSIEEAQVRVARALAGVEKKDRVAWEKKFIWAMQNGAVPAGRIFSNAGAQAHKNKVSLINCVVSDTINDSMDSILAKLHEAGMSLKAGCGIGYEFSTLRFNGAFVQGAGATTSGPLSFMDIYDKMCRTVSSAGGRRGAQMATFDIKHPDIFEYIEAKRHNGVLENFNLSVLITDEFMEAVQSDDEWALEWNGEVIRTVQARDLMDKIMMSTYNYAEPGFILVDRINKYNNLWFCEMLRATNPCVTGDTKIAVVNRGAVPIKQLVKEGKDVPVYCQNLETGEMEIRMGRNPRKTGFGHKVYKITLDDGTSFKANAVHKMITRDGQSIQVRDMKPGTSLLPFRMKENNVGEICVKSTEAFRKEHHVLAEFVEGNYLEFGRGANDLCVHHIDEDHFNNEPDNIQVLTNSEHSSHHMTVSNPMQTWWPNATRRERRAYRRSMSASQSGENNGMYGKRHSRSTLNKIGQKTSERMESPRFKSRFSGAVRAGMKSESAVEGLAKSIRSRAAKCGSAALALGFELSRNKWHKYADEVREMCGSFVQIKTIEKYFDSWSEFKKASRDYNHKVVSIEQCGVEDVYNITVDVNHNYFIVTNEYEKDGKRRWSGVLSRNCGEQPLPPYGSCLLGSINLALFVRNAFTPQACFDFDKFREVISVFARMLDNVVEISELPLEGQHREIISKRRHGMGYMGLGSALAMMCIPYGSEAGVDFTRKVTQVLAYMNYTAGYELAREKGEAPILQQMHNVSDIPHNFNTNFRGKSASYKGRTLFLESHYFDNFEGDDEGALIMGKIKKYGCRFSHATSIAPTGTIAFGLGNNVSNGIEPSFMNYYLRNRIEPGKATKEQVAVYSFEMLAYKEYVKAGLVKHDGEVTDKNLPSYFSTSDTVSVRGHIDTQAAAQEWIDSSISKTVNVPRDISFNDFKEVYTYAWLKGLKGCATYRPNPERFSGVLVRPEEQASTLYEFVTESGDVICARGDEKIQYRGEEHIAANLAEAIRNGYFGKN